MKSQSVLDALFQVLENPDVRRATKYISPKLTAKATRRHKYSARAKYEEFVVTCGAPNYAERAFIKLCKKAKEPFPVKKIQIKFWPKKKKV